MKYIIFDFDGTVANTLPHLISIGEKVLGIKVEKSEIEELRNTPAKKIIKKFRVPIYKIPKMLVQGRKMFSQHIHEIEPVEGLVPVIEKLHASGYHMQIISSNSVANIQIFLEQHNLRRYFTQVHGSVGLFNKAQAIRKVIRSQKLPLEQCVYIGDEVRDIEAAHKVGIKIISVTSGLNGEKILEKTGPDFLARKPSEIIPAIKVLSQK
jgi:phosphoglycolate phosphatase